MLRFVGPARSSRLVQKMVLDFAIVVAEAHARPAVQAAEEDLQRSLTVLRQCFESSPLQTKRRDARQTEQYIRALLACDILPQLLSHLPTLRPETRTAAARVVVALVQLLPEEVGSRIVRGEVLRSLKRGTGVLDTSLHCGLVIRALASQQLLPAGGIDMIPPLLQAAKHREFVIGADAVATLSAILTKGQCALRSFQVFVSGLRRIHDANFALRSQLLRLLSAILHKRANHGLLTRYVVLVHNLRWVMSQLNTPMLCVQVDAYNVLKLFIANPTKSDPVARLLGLNCMQLSRWILDLHRRHREIRARRGRVEAAEEAGQRLSSEIRLLLPALVLCQKQLT